MTALAPSFADTAKAARVRWAQRADGTVIIYTSDGRASLGRLHRNPSGWAAVEELRGTISVEVDLDMNDVDGTVATVVPS